MCQTTPGRSGAFADGLGEVRTGRRTLLTAGAAGLAFSTLAGPAAEAATTRKRCYVLVVDGCRPDEVDSGLMPNLAALRAGGLHYPRASSMPVMETIPNHVMMMTGIRPDRTGVPANVVYDRGLRDFREMDRPSDIKVDTVIQRMNRQGLSTGTVLSKEYLYGVFGGRATHRWEPAPIIPVSEHAPDVFTMDATLTMIEEMDPHLVFVNLGDIDRMGHSDLTGPLGARAGRRAVLVDTDQLVGRFVDLLKSTGRWRHSMVIVLADHSMDWSKPDRIVTLTPVIEADPLLAGKVQVAANGGTDLLYWTGPRKRREEAVRRMRKLALGVPGVLATHDRRQDWLRLGPEAGDVVVFCKAGWRFSDPNPVTDNPIPGNHGHPATRSIPFFIGGGHPRVPKRRASSRHATTVDVAPTVADFFGLSGKPRGGWDGRSRI